MRREELDVLADALNAQIEHKRSILTARLPAPIGGHAPATSDNKFPAMNKRTKRKK